MTILRPVPDVRQITRFGPFSCHLVEHDDGLTLIDTNLPGSLAGIAREIASLHKPLRRVLLTHAHADHVGSLDAIKEAFPDAEIVAGRRTARLLSGDRTLDPAEQGLALKGGFATTATRPSIVVDADGEYAGFRAIDTPGHAVGHISWLQLDTGYLFAGDAFVSAGGGLHVTGVFRLGFPFPYFATASRTLAVESARRIAELGPTVILPVHGPAVSDPRKDITAAIADAERRIRSGGGQG